jgi:hypothetical protein
VCMSTVVEDSLKAKQVNLALLIHSFDLCQLKIPPGKEDKALQKSNNCLGVCEHLIFPLCSRGACRSLPNAV